jgi:hypothetical protein
LRPDAAPRSGPKQKANPHFFVFIRSSLSIPQLTPSAYPPGPNAAWLLICPPPYPACARRAVMPFPFPIAGHRAPSLPALLTWQPRLRRSVGLPHHALPHHRPCRTPSLPAPLTYVAVTCVARSLAVRLSLIAVGRAAEPAMAAGVHVPWRLRSSPTEPRAPASMAGVSGARTPRLATGSHPDGRNRLAQPSLPYVVYVCLKCFRCMLQLFHLDVAKVDWGCRTCCIC